LAKGIAMAFEMAGEFVLPASREEVWKALNDPDVLAACVQGCQRMERVDTNSFAAEVKMKIGPVASVFNGTVDLLDLDPPNSYRIHGQGDGGAAGFAKGGARVSLSEAADGTLLRYDVNADIGGKLAQLGGRLIDGVAKRQADKFFAKFAEHFGPQGLIAPTQSSLEQPVVASSKPAQPAQVQTRAPIGWFFALAIAILAGFLLGRSDANTSWLIAVIALAISCAWAGFAAGRR